MTCRDAYSHPRRDESVYVRYYDNSLKCTNKNPFSAPQDLPLCRWSSQHRCLRSSRWWCRRLFRCWPQGCWYSHGNIHEELWCCWRVHCWIKGEKASVAITLRFIFLLHFRMPALLSCVSFLLPSLFFLLSSSSTKAWINVIKIFLFWLLIEKV